MRFRLYREYGALNSVPVFDAFEQGLKSLGHEISTSDDSIPVIWSVLWAGRMSANKQIYDRCKKDNKPIVIIEVGNLFRGKTWRISLNHINADGIFGNDLRIDNDRPKKLGIFLSPSNQNRKSEILIATQHQNSLQWENMSPMSEWVSNTVAEIRKYTDRKIKVRPHPRSPVRTILSDVEVMTPKQLPGTYDDFDIDYNYHCVINHNSGPSIQAAIKGTPVICDRSSLAYPISDRLENIENVSLPDREKWFINLCHTEWTVDEIKQGIPQRRVIEKISN